MKAPLTSGESRFHQQIIDFINTAYPLAVRQAPTDLDKERWFKAVSDKGWMTVEWPTEAGGTGWSPVELMLWYQELAHCACPSFDYFALQSVGPLLWRMGTVQQQRHLDAISRRDKIWGNATFDMSSVQVKLLPQKNCHVIQGTAPCIVTTATGSGGPDWVLLLGNNEEEDAGSLYLLDLQTPGIELTPVSSSSTGTSVFRLDFNHVYLPADALLGNSGKGQDILDENRQGDQSLSNLVHIQTALIQLRQLIRSFALEEEFESRLADIDIQIHANCITGLRHRLNGSDPSTQQLTPFILKGEQITFELDSLLNDALGYYALPALLPEPGTNEPPLRISDGTRGDYSRDLTTGRPVEHRYDMIARNILGLPPAD